MADYTRDKEGFRFHFRGMKTNSSPDSLPHGKYPIAINIRSYSDSSIRTRPGTALLFQGGVNDQFFTDIRCYSSLLTDNLPRILARTANDSIYIDSGVKVGALVGAGATFGAVMIPFRPNASPMPYMYIANGKDYQKFSAPVPGPDTVVQQKVGIAEPQSAPDAGLSAIQLSAIGKPINALNFTAAGTASGVGSATRVTNTVTGVFIDPAAPLMTTLQFAASTNTGQVTSIVLQSGGQYDIRNGPPTITLQGGGFTTQATAVVSGMRPISTQYMIVTSIAITNPGSGYTSAPTVVFNNVTGQISSASATAYVGTSSTPISSYQRFMLVTVGAGALQAMVQDVYQPIPGPLTISAIRYFTGTTGRCVIVPAGVGAESPSTDASIYDEILVNGLRRGALVQIGTEVCLVLSVSVGPNGAISFETSTVNPHTTADTLTGVQAIQILGTAQVGDTVTASNYTASVASGVGTLTSDALTFNPFLTGSSAFQSDDYFHISINIDNLANLTEMKILLDVGDGSFTRNFYYLTARPSDIAAAVLNSATQLAGVQQILQRQLIAEELQAKGVNNVDASLQSASGASQWSELLFPLSAFTRVGNDQTVNLQNIGKVQVLFNASGSLGVAWNSISIFGGYQGDVGDAGAPYLYRVRPRSQITGAIGNPSPATRYGVSARREQIIVLLPSAAYDAQIDTWDIFRYGGTVTQWRYVGSTPSINTSFIDNFSDDAVGKGDELDFDNLEPWPSVDVPNNGTASVVNGTVAVISTTDTDVLNYLPGTLVQLGGLNVYTLWARPIHLTGTNYLLQFVENAGAGTNIAYNIQEPLIANQKLPYMWGPDVSGTVFAVGDPLNPGKLYFAKPNSPDSAPSEFNIEITPPSEPLLGGEVVDGLSFVGSPERWWALYPQPDNPTQRYNFVQQPVQRGLAAPFGHCTDGKEIFFWAKDGIWGTSHGSLTDDDLFNLFPHEGTERGEVVTYNGVNVQPPEYTLATRFRLIHSNGYLYAIYVDINGLYHCLTLDLRRMAWSVDVYPTQLTAAYHVEQQVESQGALLNPVLLMGRMIDPTHTQGIVVRQVDFDGDEHTNPIACTLATREFDGGDIRAGKQWGDLYLDATPVAKGAPLTLTPMGLGAPVGTAQVIPQSASRTQQPVSVGGQVLADFLGCFLTWTDDFTKQTTPTILHVWQPSFLPKPEIAGDRVTDWDDLGVKGAKWIQGFILHADTFNVVKGIAARDSDTLATHAFTPVVQQNGESEKAYSFNQPFIAHQVRLEPTDKLAWRLFAIRWIAEPTPEVAETWTTQPSTHGLKGFMHARQASITYSSTVPVTMTVGVFDGTAPVPIILPSTGGAVQKIVVPFSFNKGQLYTYSFSGASPFQIYQDKCEVLVGQWGREDSYINRPLVGSVGGDEAEI